MEKLYRFLKASLKPLVILSCTGMAASGLWLSLVEGPARIGMGLGGFVFSWVIFPLALLPAAMAARIMVVVEKQFPRVSKCAGVFSVGYICFLLALYFALMAHYTGYHVAGLLFGVFTGAAPWAVLCLKDKDNAFFVGAVWVSTLGAIIVAALKTQGQVGFWQALGVIFAVNALVAAAQALAERKNKISLS